MAVSCRKAFRVCEKWGFSCAYCGEAPGRSKLQIDHLIPRAKGGSDDEQNLVPACVSCNQGKSSEIYIPHSIRLSTDDDGAHVISQRGVWAIKASLSDVFVSGAVYGSHRVDVSLDCYEIQSRLFWDRFVSQHIHSKDWQRPHCWSDFEAILSLARRITIDPSVRTSSKQTERTAYGTANG